MSNLKKVTADLSVAVDEFSFSAPVAYVYNPLDYARAANDLFVKRFGGSPKEAIFVGMNPGPFGMAQTGVPFGDVEMAREFLGIEAPVGRPKREHPRRQVEGFGCKRREVSGTRVWTWVKERFGTPEKFFERFYVANYCPLVFMEEGGKNRTPDKLPAAERDALFEACDRALARTFEVLGAKTAIGIGAFAEARCAAALEGTGVRVIRILHPSPASPLANKGWAPQVERQLAEAGIDI